MAAKSSWHWNYVTVTLSIANSAYTRNGSRRRRSVVCPQLGSVAPPEGGRGEASPLWVDV